MATPRTGTVSLRLIHKQDDEKTDVPKVMLTFNEGQTMEDVRAKIGKSVLFPFDFWDDRLPGRVEHELEGFVDLSELGGRICYIRSEGAGFMGSSHGSAPTVSVVVTDLTSDISLPEDEEVQPTMPPPLQLACQTPMFESKHMSCQVKEWWVNQNSRLLQFCRKEGYTDHNWQVRTWDEGTDVRGHLHCLECKEQYGNPLLSQARIAIGNIFTNFKRSHLTSATHQAAYAKRRGLKNPTRQGDSHHGHTTQYDHGEAIKTGLDIVHKLNVELGGEVSVFSVYPPTVTPEYADKSFLFKVRCELCPKLHAEMCPVKHNLEHNLRTHLVSREHVTAIQQKDVVCSIEGRTGRRGRPKKPDVRDLHPTQNSILKFFKEDGSRSMKDVGSSKGGSVDIDVGLSLLCWGLWRSKIQYRGVSYDVKSILLDQKLGDKWIAEPLVKEQVYNPIKDAVVCVKGLFRSKDCRRLSITGGGFEDLTCSACKTITLEDDFRNRVHREAQAIVPRGGRTTKTGIRLDFLTIPELQLQVKNLNIANRQQRWLLVLQAQKLCALSTRKLKLEELLGVAADRKDLRLFLRNIVTGHRNGTFGGKEGLWAFLKDAARNLERKAKGFRYSGRTKAIAQALLQFGGRQVAHCFANNLSGPSLTTLKRDRAKLVPFRAGIRVETFKEVGRILSAAKQALGILGDVPAIFAEDETRIKQRPRWEAKYDTLIGFCGPSANHTCAVGLEVEVGEGLLGYEKIVSTFEEYSKSCYARVIIVNPLHESMPKLALCVTATCNKFNADWVREHWTELKVCWDDHCRADVGPLLGHASDGDARRRKLMIEDYTGGVGSFLGCYRRFSVGWEGWTYSVAILPNGDLYGFGDQDQPHNGKKLINPLDRVSSNLVLGDQHASLSYVSTVYNHYNIHEHGLNWDDVNRTDRQNWAGPQRIASRKVQACLSDLHERCDVRHERALGTQLYLEICGNYIDVFFSVKLDLRARIVLASKVSFFFRLWRLWLRFGDHSVAGNVAKYTEKDMISTQAFHDVNMSCHFIVLLICAFRDHFPHLPVPFHLLGSDCCEIFFSKVGGMSGHERNYDFGSLIDSAIGLNRLASLEYGPEGLKVGRSHKKQDNVWGKLHPLAEGESVPNLLDYSQVQTNELVISALKEGLEDAREVMRKLQMSPRSTLPVAKRLWWLRPWEVELSVWPDTTAVMQEVGRVDDAEEEVDHASVIGPAQPGAFHEIEDPEEDLSRRDEWVDEDNVAFERRLRGEDGEPNLETVDGEPILDPIDGDSDGVSSAVELEVVGHEARHAISSVLQEFTTVTTDQTRAPIVQFVVYEGRRIYKSTLVAQLVGNPYLSKDRLTRVKQVLYYTTGTKRNADEMDRNICFVDVGSDCAIAFIKKSTNRPITRSSQVRIGKGRGSGKDRGRGSGNMSGRMKSGIMEPTANASKMFFIGRIVQIRQKYNKQWGRTRSPIDLQDRPSGPNNTNVCQLLFNWYSAVNNNNIQYTYDSTDLQWIDIEEVLCSVTLTMKEGGGRMYLLDVQDKLAIDRCLATITI